MTVSFESCFWSTSGPTNGAAAAGAAPTAMDGARALAKLAAESHAELERLVQCIQLRIAAEETYAAQLEAAAGAATREKRPPSSLPESPTALALAAAAREMLAQAHARESLAECMRQAVLEPLQQSVAHAKSQHGAQFSALEQAQRASDRLQAAAAAAATAVTPLPSAAYSALLETVSAAGGASGKSSAPEAVEILEKFLSQMALRVRQRRTFRGRDILETLGGPGLFPGDGGRALLVAQGLLSRGFLVAAASRVAPETVPTDSQDAKDGAPRPSDELRFSAHGTYRWSRKTDAATTAGAPASVRAAVAAAEASRLDTERLLVTFLHGAQTRADEHVVALKTALVTLQRLESDLLPTLMGFLESAEAALADLAPDAVLSWIVSTRATGFAHVIPAALVLRRVPLLKLSVVVGDGPTPSSVPDWHAQLFGIPLSVYGRGMQPVRVHPLISAAVTRLERDREENHWTEPLAPHVDSAYALRASLAVAYASTGRVKLDKASARDVQLVVRMWLAELPESLVQTDLLGDLQLLYLDSGAKDGKLDANARARSVGRLLATMPAIHVRTLRRLVRLWHDTVLSDLDSFAEHFSSILLRPAAAQTAKAAEARGFASRFVADMVRNPETVFARDPRGSPGADYAVDGEAALAAARQRRPTAAWLGSLDETADVSESSGPEAWDSDSDADSVSSAASFDDAASEDGTTLSPSGESALAGLLRRVSLPSFFGSSANSVVNDQAPPIVMSTLQQVSAPSLPVSDSVVKD